MDHKDKKIKDENEESVFKRYLKFSRNFYWSSGTKWIRFFSIKNTAAAVGKIGV